MYHKDTIRKHIKRISDRIGSGYFVNIEDKAGYIWFSCDCCNMNTYYRYDQQPPETVGYKLYKFHKPETPYDADHMFAWNDSDVARQYPSLDICLDCHAKIMAKVDYILGGNKAKDDFRRELRKLKNRLKKVRHAVS